MPTYHLYLLLYQSLVRIQQLVDLTFHHLLFGKETCMLLKRKTYNQLAKYDVKFICKIPGSGAGCIGQEKPELLPQNHLHAAVNEMPTEDHRLCLVKYVANTYLNLRLSSYAKIYSKAVIQFGKPSSRHHLTKTILFLNQ